MNARQIAALLAQLPSVDLAGPTLLVRLLDAEVQETPLHTFVNLQPQIVEAAEEMYEHARAVQEITQRCTRLSAIPNSKTPPGF